MINVYQLEMGISQSDYLATRMHSSKMRTARSSSHLLGSVCLSACWDAPLGLETPLGVGLETPLGVGLETPSQTPNFPPPPGVGLETPPARPLNLPLGLGLDIPPVNRILDTPFLKYYLAPTSLRAIIIDLDSFSLTDHQYLKKQTQGNRYDVNKAKYM